LLYLIPIQQPSKGVSPLRSSHHRSLPSVGILGIFVNCHCHLTFSTLFPARVTEQPVSAGCRRRPAEPAAGHESVSRDGHGHYLCGCRLVYGSHTMTFNRNHDYCDDHHAEVQSCVLIQSASASGPDSGLPGPELDDSGSDPSPANLSLSLSHGLPVPPPGGPRPGPHQQSGSAYKS
jgi:hypothetical protein